MPDVVDVLGAVVLSLACLAFRRRAGEDKVVVGVFEVVFDESMGNAGMKVMKNGVSSPLKGVVMLSVVFPRKIWSFRRGGDGLGSKKSSVKGLSARVARDVDLFDISFDGIVILEGTVPFLKVIWKRKLG
jgi:hypothetical protein